MRHRWIVYAVIVVLLLAFAGAAGCKPGDSGGNPPIYDPPVCTTVDGSHHSDVPCFPTGPPVTKGSRA